MFPDCYLMAPRGLRADRAGLLTYCASSEDGINAVCMCVCQTLMYTYMCHYRLNACSSSSVEALLPCDGIQRQGPLGGNKV